MSPSKAWVRRMLAQCALRWVGAPMVPNAGVDRRTMVGEVMLARVNEILGYSVVSQKYLNHSARCKRDSVVSQKYMNHSGQNERE